MREENKTKRGDWGNGGGGGKKRDKVKGWIIQEQLISGFSDQHVVSVWLYVSLFSILKIN